MVALDTLVVSTALTTIRADLGASRRAARVDGERLQPQLRRAADDRRRRSATASAAGALFAAGLALFALASAALRAGARRRLADRRAGRAGRRRGVRHAARARARERRVPARAARRRRSARCSGAHRARGRDAARSSAARSPRASPGSGSSGSTCRSGSPSIPLALRADAREPRAATRALDLPGLALVTLAALGVVWGLVRGNAAGWGSAEVVGSLAAGLAAARPRSCAWEARARAPMLPLGLLPLARVLGRQRRDLPDVRVAVRRGVLPRAVPADRPRRRRRSAPGLRLLPWTATLFFVAPGRRRARRPLRRAAVHRRRAALQAIGLGWIALVADPAMAYVEMVAAADHRRLRRLDGVPGGAERGRRRGRAGRRSARRRASTARCASSAACSGSRWPSRCSPAPAATRRRRRSPTASPRDRRGGRAVARRGGGRGAPAGARAPGGAHSVRRRSSAIVIATLSRAGASTRDPRAARRWS